MFQLASGFDPFSLAQSAALAAGGHPWARRASRGSQLAPSRRSPRWSRGSLPSRAARWPPRSGRRLRRGALAPSPPVPCPSPLPPPPAARRAGRAARFPPVRLEGLLGAGAAFGAAPLSLPPLRPSRPPASRPPPIPLSAPLPVPRSLRAPLRLPRALPVLLPVRSAALPPPSPCLRLPASCLCVWARLGAPPAPAFWPQVSPGWACGLRPWLVSVRRGLRGRGTGVLQWSPCLSVPSL